QEMLYHLQDLVKALEIKLKHVENLAFKLEKHGQVINKQLENAHSKLQQDHDRILDAANNVQMTAQATGQQLSKELNDKLTKFQKEAQKKSEKSKKFTRGKMVGGSAGL
ncbi:MAG TPA: hypothetical protein VLG50_01885, partial [Candidatus Saccharimonadales bacterium]|nr:hypothetical protein [Candidatus Saccharimonadales bacterium]